jgi:hypothetical protein
MICTACKKRVIGNGHLCKEMNERHIQGRIDRFHYEIKYPDRNDTPVIGNSKDETYCYPLWPYTLPIILGGK